MWPRAQRDVQCHAQSGCSLPEVTRGLPSLEIPVRSCWVQTRVPRICEWRHGACDTLALCTLGYELSRIPFYFLRTAHQTLLQVIFFFF